MQPVVEDNYFSSEPTATPKSPSRHEFPIPGYSGTRSELTTKVGKACSNFLGTVMWNA